MYGLSRALTSENNTLIVHSQSLIMEMASLIFYALMLTGRMEEGERGRDGTEGERGGEREGNNGAEVILGPFEELLQMHAFSLSQCITVKSPPHRRSCGRQIHTCSNLPHPHTLHCLSGRCV